MQLLARNLMPHKPEMFANMHAFAGFAGQAGASAPNGASTGQMSPILVGPCLVKDNMDPLSNAPRTDATISLAIETTLKHQCAYSDTSRSITVFELGLVTLK